MNRNQKFLRKLNLKERARADEAIKLITQGNLIGLDVKKLKGHKTIFRVKVGRIRIVYSITESIGIKILLVESRDEKTYSKIKSLFF